MIKIITDILSKVYRIFNRKDKIKFWLVAFTQMIEGIFELLTTAILPIFIMCLSNPNKVRESILEYVNLDFIRTLSDVEIIYLFSIITISIVAIKSVISIVIVCT